MPFLLENRAMHKRLPQSLACEPAERQAEAMVQSFVAGAKVGRTPHPIHIRTCAKKLLLRVPTCAGCVHETPFKIQSLSNLSLRNDSA